MVQYLRYGSDGAKGLGVSGPLAGVRVIDLTRLLPGGFATLLLSSLGADVVKVEEPAGGDGIRQMMTFPGQSGSAGHVVLNRGKRSVALNLKDSRAQQILRELIAGADVLIDSFRPGVLDRLGLSDDQLKKANPQLVHVSITAFARSAGYEAIPAHDLNSVGYAGLLGFTAVDDVPALPGIQNADLAAGFHAALAVFAGLRVRDESGLSYRADISMAEAAATLTPLQVATVFGTGMDPAVPDTLTGALACYGVYQCADGEFLTVGALEPKFFARMCELMGLSELAGEQYGSTDQRDLRAGLAAAFVQRPRSEWLELLASQDTCVAPALTVSQALEHELFRDNGTVTTVRLPGGETGRVFRATPWDRSTPDSDTAAELGADTRRILDEIGISDAQFQALVDSGLAVDGNNVGAAR